MYMPLSRHVFPGPAQGLPEQLLPYMRLAHATDSEALRRATLETCCAAPISPDNERTVLHQLASHLQACLAKCAGVSETL